MPFCAFPCFYSPFLGHLLQAAISCFVVYSGQKAAGGSGFQGKRLQITIVIKLSYFLRSIRQYSNVLILRREISTSQNFTMFI